MHATFLFCLRFGWGGGEIPAGLRPHINACVGTTLEILEKSPKLLIKCLLRTPVVLPNRAGNIIFCVASLALPSKLNHNNSLVKVTSSERATCRREVALQ